VWPNRRWRTSGGAVDDHTDTADVEATVRQVAELAEAGSELVRITVNSAGRRQQP